MTAQRRGEALSRVPISITAATQAQLDAKGIRNIADLARDTPGLNYRADNELDQPNISIRGIASVVGSATTGVYLDESPIASRYVAYFAGLTAFPQLFDLDRVEVLRGPQGTLFGAGSEGGTIRFITPKPSLTTYSGYGRADVGFTDGGQPSYEVGSAVGGPIVTDTLGFRASVWTQTVGGYVDRIDRQTGAITAKNTNDARSFVGRASLLWRPIERLTITPAFFYQKQKREDRSTFWEVAGFARTFDRVPSESDDRLMIGSLAVEYEADLATITSVTSYFNRRQDRIDDYTYSEFSYYGGQAYFPELPGFLGISQIDTFQNSWTQELRATSSGTGPLSVTAGLFFMRSRTGYEQNEYSPQFDALTQVAYGLSVEEAFGRPLLPGGIAYFGREVQRDQEYSGFGEIGYNITDRLKFSAGARYSRTTYSLDINRAGPVSGPPLYLRRSGGSNPLTPRCSISYQARDTLLYATAAKGFRVGGGNTTIAMVSGCASDLAALGAEDIPSGYEPDSVWSYEVGSKTRIGSNVRLSGSLYWIDWNQIQTNIVLPVCGYNYTTNAGKARSRGFDMQATIQPVEGLSLSGTLGYNDARFTEDVSTGSAFVILKGTRISTPKWTATVGAQYDFVVSGGLKPYLRGDFQYNSSYTRGYSPGTVSYDADTNGVDAMKFTSLRGGVRRGGFDFSIYANNLFNTRPILSRYHEVRGSAEFRNISIRPRTIGATATHRF